VAMEYCMVLVLHPISIDEDGRHCASPQNVVVVVEKIGLLKNLLML
jgi:hypothetical protein